MEFAISIAMVDVKVKMNNHDLNDREVNILEVFLLNLAAQSNASSTKMGMALNPLEKLEHDTVLHYRFAWQSSISEELYGEFKEGLERRYSVAFKMCDLPEGQLLFKENAYIAST
ncbi:hypothetical protein FZC74_17715 [Sutcliffiella horikoshii]|uniref:Uncharacterized protein n=1 Tax=Sutcliffiella horikoshii TaxID=79883 RepID=A0AA94WMF4_9BACI|nr:hypothetical protein [Sutcliffiella horikoshii]TYS55896.1 hypothetical protein FZC74_17715 [Sutcliffiella horikoshii]